MVAAMLRFYLFLVGSPEPLLEQLQKAALAELDGLPSEFGFKTGSPVSSRAETGLQKIELVKKILGQQATGKVLLSRQEEEKVLRETPLEFIASLAGQWQENIERVTLREKRLKEMEAELELIEHLDLAPAELKTLKGFSGRFYSLPAARGKTLEEKKEFPFYVLHQGHTRSLILVLLPEEKSQRWEKELMEQGASPVPITPYGRRPALILKQVRLRLQQLKREKEKVMAEREKLLQWREKVLVLSDWYRSRLLVEESFRLVGTSRLVHGFSGWVPRTSLRQFQQLLDKYAPDHCLVTRPALPEENPPVKLENPPLVRPFEVVTDLYGRPVYGTLDPSGPLSFFFALSFAYCLTDAAYGIILAGLSLWLTHRFRYQLQLRKFFQLMIISGLATVILGTLTGGWCGDLLSRLPPGWSVRESLQRLVLLNPLGGNREAFLFLGLAIVLGYLQILWGLFLNLWGQRRNLPGMLEPGLLFLIQLLLPIIGLSGLTGPGNRTVFITSLASFGFCLLMLTIIKAAEQKEVMLKLFWAFYAPYNVLAGNLLGDPLSYCRLFGLGLTTSVLGLAINEMVSLAREVPVIGFVLAGLLFLFGHLGNLAINLLGAYVHSSRLQYLEFFGKFFQAGGRSFQPLSEVREHTILREASS